MHLRIGIDLDGVVADFNSGWISRYNEDFGASIPLDAVQSWDGIRPLTHFPDMGGFWSWARDHGRGSIFRHLEPYEGALPALLRLDGAGHGIVVITTKPDWAVHDTFAWIAEHRIPTTEVHMTWDKWRIPCDVYLDDAPHQLETLVSARPEALTCRFVRPWNKPVAGVHDVPDWEAFEAVVTAAAAVRASGSDH
jgi:5'(3')-deoxyribonucleotidase